MTTSLTVLDKCYSASNRKTALFHQQASQMKQAGTLSTQLAADNLGGITGFSEGRRQRELQSLYRGWVWDAINALASRGAGQSAHVGKLTNVDVEEDRSAFFASKYLRRNMTRSLAHRAAATSEVEIVPSGGLVDLLEQPNNVQDRWQFTYSFIANLALTGWSYIVYGETNGRKELYSLPTTWVTPDHSKGPFSKFKVRNPRKQTAKAEEFDRSQVAFAYIPNPSDPLSAVAPAEAKIRAIRIDDSIQASQDVFFDNGIFPSVVVTVGRNPHPEVPGGLRPRLNAAQRRQVYAAIGKQASGAMNYGTPAIVDGLIESITRLSATHNEMGWDKSEDKVRDRILSTFAVHPFILGLALQVGGYAQAATIEKLFCDRVNTYLDLLSVVLTNFFGQEEREEAEPGTLIWWEECHPYDPEQDRRWWETGRKNGDIRPNEFRTQMGLPPDEEMLPVYLDRAGAAEVNKLLANLGEGKVQPSQAQGLLTAMGLPPDLVTQMTGTTEPTSTERVESAVAALQGSLGYLNLSPRQVAQQLISQS